MDPEPTGEAAVSTTTALRTDFMAATGRGITVAVLDSGWPPDRTDPRVLEGLSVVEEPPLVEGRVPQHGTMCALRVLQVAPECRILPIRVFARGNETSVERVCQGIELARGRGVDVINLSLATRLSQAIRPMFDACETARTEGIIVVAAAHNRRFPAVPAYLEPALSVDEGRDLALLEFTFDPGRPIECTAAGIGAPVVDQEGLHHRMGGSSVAAATMSGLVARLRQVRPDVGLDEVRDLLPMIAHLRLSHTVEARP